ncbi:MAG TPA: AsmA-like C-terminal region-containing protein [Candidatus Sulfotelmatobacter sp.]|nr:AsmA-like C-terminal region-containing protein [Candidatus Sulfotelmatobacter sp.]
MPLRTLSSRWKWFLGISIGIFALVGISVRIVIVRAEPILRTRVIETLSTRFHSRVDLAELHVWIENGINVEGKGLKIFGATDPNPSESGIQPLIAVRSFRFQTALRNLFREPMYVNTVFISGLTMNIPPKNDRAEMTKLRRRGGKMSIFVSHFLCMDTKLIVNTDKAGKAPLEFDISRLQMRDIGPARPLQFDANLINPKPVGNIHSTGYFGPLNETDPRNSAVEGEYSFNHADLSTLKGIGGILSSTGRYGGTLGRIEVTGETDTPDFHLAVTGHDVPLHTQFHAIVDGTDGDTYLDPVNARVLDSSFTAVGRVVRTSSPHGHDIELKVTLGNARIQDLLQLGVRTEPPIMTGRVEMNARLSLPPGEADVSDRLRLSGNFHLPSAHFTNEKLQTRIDALSLRTLGEPKLVPQAATIKVGSDLSGDFQLQQGLLSFSSLRFEVPGTRAKVSGNYSLDGKTFDFHGKLQLNAKVSQMTTGWKSLLLKAVDPFLSKNGYGTEVPFKITGTQSEPHFGLDFHSKDNDSERNAEGTMEAEDK